MCFEHVFNYYYVINISWYNLTWFNKQIVQVVVVVRVNMYVISR